MIESTHIAYTGLTLDVEAEIPSRIIYNPETMVATLYIIDYKTKTLLNTINNITFNATANKLSSIISKELIKGYVGSVIKINIVISLKDSNAVNFFKDSIFAETYSIVPMYNV